MLVKRKKHIIGFCNKLSVRKTFNDDEDIRMTNLVRTYGTESWKIIANHMPGRSARQCRERWRNYLDPEIRNDPWTVEEDELLSRLIKQYGTHWSQISAFFKHKSDIALKNRWAFLGRSTHRKKIYQDEKLPEKTKKKAKVPKKTAKKKKLDEQIDPKQCVDIFPNGVKDDADLIEFWNEQDFILNEEHNVLGCNEN